MGNLKQLQERISSIFYSHGLFCASHPFAIISAVIIIQIITCSPLLNFPLPGNAPLQYRTPAEGYTPPLPAPETPRGPQHTPKSAEAGKPPRWYLGQPVAYMQQLIIHVAVSPWQPQRLIPSDAFRAPLDSVFDILEQIQTFTHNEGEKTSGVSDICLHVSEGLKREQIFKGFLPHYNCLMLSPANFWQRDRQRFRDDPDVLKTVFDSYGQKLDNPPTIRDLLFGISRKDTGLAKYYLRNRQRVISFAVTLTFTDYNPKFLAALKEKLYESYPLSSSMNNSTDLIHLHFKDLHYIVEYTPLLVTYVVLFLYIYFSVRKIEMVKSKWGLALSAVVTVIASLLMSVSICLLFGLTPSLNGSEIFPYLVVIIGLENVLVVTKSVVSTPVYLDVKLRVAKGLSKEGWFIFKHVMTELIILAVGFLTFVPAIQEFCVFALVGLMSDLYLQMFFFTSVLSIDIRRMELSDLHKQSVQQALHDNPCAMQSHTPAPLHCPFMRHLHPSVPSTHLRPSTPPPSPSDEASNTSSNSGFRGGKGMNAHQHDPPAVVKVPRRVQLLNFWASTRVVQRLIMACVVWWILMFVYKAGIVDHIFYLGNHNSDQPSPTMQQLLARQSSGTEHDEWVRTLLRHDDAEPWKKLSYLHWPTVFGYYNISLYGRYLSMLPPILLSIDVPPDTAIERRHPLEEARYAHQTATATYMDPDSGDPLQHPPTHSSPEESAASPSAVSGSPFPPNESLSLVLLVKRLTHYPRNQTEVAATVMLAVATLILFVYGVAACYKCVCPRNYAKWRTGWGSRGRAGGGGRGKSPYYKQIRDSVPLVLQGHLQEIECIVTDGPLVVSSCLGGQLRVWDSNSGECITAISRRGLSAPICRRSIPGRNMDDSDADLYAEYHGQPPTPPPPPSSPPVNTKPRGREHARCKSYGSPFDFMPDLSDTIDTNFYGGSSSRLERSRSVADGKQFQQQQQYENVHNEDLVSLSSPLRTTPSPLRTTTSPFSTTTSPLSTTTSPLPTTTSPLPTTATPTTTAQPIPPTTSSSSSNILNSAASSPSSYDFSRFEEVYKEHAALLDEQHAYIERKRQQRQSVDKRLSTSSWDDIESISGGDSSIEDSACPAVWCLACQDNLIVAGCGNGKIEFWDGLSGQLKYLYSDSKVGVTAVCFVANKVLAARLNGNVDFLELETFLNIHRSAATSSAVHKRGHFRKLSNQGVVSEMKTWDDIIRCNLLSTARAHQKPINLLKSEGGRLVTGSQDHTLKVFRLEDSLCLYTLHGHSGNITALFLDKVSPLAAASGSEDGTVRLWDLLTGNCVHKLEAHVGAVSCLVMTPQHVISAGGTDDRLAVWERVKGQLVHWIQMEPGFCSTLSMLTSRLMVTGGQQGTLYLWDVAKGEILRSVQLGDADTVFIRNVHVINNSAVVCDYANQLRVIHFPSVLEKAD